MPDDHEHGLTSESGSHPVLAVDVAAPLRVAAATLMALVPEVVVDGVVRARGWGNWLIPVSAGRHQVRIHIDRFGVLLHPAQLVVTVDPGERVPIHYRMPASGFASASIGTTPQRARGGGRLVAVLLVPVLLVPILVTVAAVLALLLA
ncbi:hypothetical protein [Nocardia veterana]|uniref:Uncharacterized protein n=1 Tax=Nocardia veterana TaxID=132249 RepID=A0A7X6M2R7_9NOCA|nr:hypothetical protein [Nocardia veterana]NKY89102.1 hypothetical protein [Nocardia veterana]